MQSTGVATLRLIYVTGAVVGCCRHRTVARSNGACSTDFAELVAGWQANTHLLATCYYRAGQPFRAYRVLQKTTFPASRYLLALACMQLPDKLPEAERVLDPGRNGKDVRGPF